MSRGRDDSLEREPAETRQGPTAPAREVSVRPREGPASAFHLPRGVQREPVLVRGRRYRLRGSESRLLEVVGTFRAVFTRDLVHGTHAGDPRQLAADVHALTAQGLVQHRRLAADRHGHTVVALSLTDAGKVLLEHHRTGTPSGFNGRPQAVYSGWVRPAELVHDATLYRMYLEEAARITREGGTVRRIVLDHELKGDLYRALHVDPAMPPADRDTRLHALAATHHLTVVDGHVQFPDLRLEVETAAGERTRVDLELATEAYHAGHLRAKARAGFTVYRASAGHGGAGRLVRGGGSEGRGGAGYHPDYLSGLLSL